MKNLLVLMLAGALLAGCAGRVTESVDDAAARAAYADRAMAIESWREWGFTGRLGIRGAEDGGSGRIDWSVAGDHAVLQFRGALGQGAWRLETDAIGATLTRADGSVVRAADADALAFAEVGWRVPVEALARWVRGLASATTQSATKRIPPGLSLDARGLPLSLEQGGWQVTFERYDNETGAWLPGRVQAEQGETRVRLVISQWRHDGDKAGDN